MIESLRTLLFTAIISCSVIPPEPNTLNHEEFRPYTEDFSKIVDNEKLKSRIDKTVIMFSNLNTEKKEEEKRTLGICYRTPLRLTIVIDEEYWKYASPTNKAFTMYHELGHCVCNLEHTEITESWYKPFQQFFANLGLIKLKPRLPDGCPGSIMHPYDMGEFCMLNNFMYYLEEIKESCNAN